MGFYAIWNHKGPDSGTFTTATSQAAIAAAEAAGWGQDARAYTGLQLIDPETPAPLPAPAPTPTPPPPPPPPPADPAPPPPPPPADPEPDPDCDTDAKAHHGRGKAMVAGETYATRHIETAPNKRGRGRPRKAA